MTPHTSYNPSQDFSVLLIGPPLSGKTTVALQFPDPYIISTDRKLQNAVQRLPAGKRWWYDYVDIDPAGKHVAEGDRWNHIFGEKGLLKSNLLNPEVKTIILDNLTDLSTILYDHILAAHAASGKGLFVGGVRVFEQQHWQPFKILMTRVISTCKAAGKYFVVCCHETVDKDEITGTLIYQPLIPGQLRGSLGQFFTNVWRTEIEQDSKGAPSYYLRTTPTARISLGNSIGLPDKFVFSWQKLEEYINKSRPQSGS